MPSVIAAVHSQLGRFHAPHVDWKGMSPLLAVLGGSVVVLMVGLLPGRRLQRGLVPALGIVSLLTAIGLTIWIWQPGDTRPIVAGALSIDTLALGISVLFYVSGIVTILLSLRSDVMRQAGPASTRRCCSGSIGGMVLLAGAENLVTLFIGIELLSIPLYILCGSRVLKERSLEAGLKYLIIGSVGSATLLYGLALIYGATGSTDLSRHQPRDRHLGAAGRPAAPDRHGAGRHGLAFKASVAPFHQWTPDVYQGAPTPVTAFMAVATKAAAFAILLRLFDKGLISAHAEWAPALAALAAVTIVIGNVGAMAQSSLKRMLGWSGVAQAGYMLAGVVVGTRLGLQATAFYLAVYLLMNVAAFAVVIARERVSELGDDIRSLQGLGRSSPWLAWPMTIAMLALAGIPATAGFIGKFYLIDASVSGHYAWLGVVIVVGSMISLAYYLRVLAVMWMAPADIELPSAPRRRLRPVAGWSPEADARAQPEVVAVAVLAAAATIVLGIVPQPLFHLAHDVGTSLSSLKKRVFFFCCFFFFFFCRAARRMSLPLPPTTASLPRVAADVVAAAPAVQVVVAGAAVQVVVARSAVLGVVALVAAEVVVAVVTVQLVVATVAVNGVDACRRSRSPWSVPSMSSLPLVDPELLLRRTLSLVVTRCHRSCRRSCRRFRRRLRRASL